MNKPKLTLKKGVVLLLQLTAIYTTKTAKLRERNFSYFEYLIIALNA